MHKMTSRYHTVHYEGGSAGLYCTTVFGSVSGLEWDRIGLPCGESEWKNDVWNQGRCKHGHPLQGTTF